MKFIIYARKSSEDKERQIQSIPDQLRLLNELAQREGFEIVETITDEKSAKQPGREGFACLKQRIESGEADAILCWKIDRLARNPVDSGWIQWNLMQGDIARIATPERMYYPEDNALLLSVESGMATQYSRDLSKNVTRGMSSKRESGWRPNRAPIGYLNDPQGLKGEKKIFIDPKLFPIIESLWRKVLNEHCTRAELYRYMEAECPIYRDGSLISKSSFYAIFKRKFYAGVFEWKGEEMIGSHKPMITLGEFGRVQEIFNGTFKTRERGLDFIYKGLFSCGGCGACITAEQHPKFIKSLMKRVVYIYYRCAHRKKNTNCTEKSISETKVEEFLMSEVEQLDIPPEILEFGIEQLNEADPFEDSVKEVQLRDAISRQEQKVKRIADNLADEPQAEIREAIHTKLKEERITLHGLKQELDKVQEEWVEPYKEITDTLELILRAKQVVENGTKEQKRDLVRGLGSNWKVLQQNLHYAPHFVPKAIKQFRKANLDKNGRFELLKSQSGTGRSLSREELNVAWSG